MLHTRSGSVGMLGIALLSLTAFSLVSSPAISSTKNRSASRAIETSQPPVEAVDGVPMAFEVNVGQRDERVRFVTRGRGYAVFLTDEDLALSLAPDPEKGRRAALRLRCTSADTNALVERASISYGRWEYRVAATGQVLQGTASSIQYIRGRSLVTSDSDDPRVAMNASLSYASNTGTVTITDRTTGARYTLRDKNLANTPCL
jgi:hypothetical protein